MTARTVLDGEGEVRAAVGRDLGESDWLDITAERLYDFMEATGSPDTTYLAISLSNMFLPQIVEVKGFSMGINYGTGAVTFGEPLYPGDMVRGRATLVDVADVKGGIQTRMNVVVEVVAGSEPACTVEALSRWLT